jgi:peptide/nickel transport system substrate-binding protein
MGLTGSNEPNNGANVWKSTGRLHMFDVKSFQVSPITRDWEKEIDELFNQGVQVLDFASRKKIYDKFQEIVTRENPFIYLASPKVLSAVNNNIAKVKPTKYAGIMPYYYQVYLQP